MASAKTYRDQTKCPKGHKFVAIRRTSSAGKEVATYCPSCNKQYKLLAGRAPV